MIFEIEIYPITTVLNGENYPLFPEKTWCLKGGNRDQEMWGASSRLETIKGEAIDMVMYLLAWSIGDALDEIYLRHCPGRLYCKEQNDHLLKFIRKNGNDIVFIEED